MYDTLIQAGQKWTHSIKTAVTCIHIFQRNILFKNENTHMINDSTLDRHLNVVFAPRIQVC